MEIYWGKEDKEILGGNRVIGEGKTGKGGQREKMGMRETRWIYWGKGSCRCKLGVQKEQDISKYKHCLEIGSIAL